MKVFDPVQWELKSGAVATGVIDAKLNGAAKIRVYRGGQPSNDFVLLPEKLLSPGPSQLRAIGDRDLITVSVQKNSGFGPPSATELRQINKIAPYGAEEISADEVITFPLMVMNNLVNRNGYRLSLEAINDLAALAPGKVLVKDHGGGWLSGYKINEIWGRMLSVRIEKGGVPTSTQINMGGMAKWQRKIIEKEGYVQAIVTAYAPANSEMVNAARLGLRPNTSVGLMYFDGVQCPLCEAAFGGEDCHHLIPVYWKRTAEYYDVDPDKVAPYWIFDRMTALGENSCVVDPGVVGAGFVTNNKDE